MVDPTGPLDSPAAGESLGTPDPNDEELNLSSSLYLQLKALWGDGSNRRRSPRRKRQRSLDPSEQAFGKGRDPKGLGDVMGEVTAELGWTGSLAQSDLIAAWTEIAGADTAAHSHPVDISDGTLTVQCESTAWATQLRLMRSMILGQIDERFPDAGISNVRFLAPHAPSWKKGARSIPGRGPRDTYG